jgi:hypothetical protein
MDIIAQLGSILGLSLVSGINLYATVAVVGLVTKYDLVSGLPPDFSLLANDAVIFVALFLYAIEFLMDKIPGLDTLWDTLHTLIRPFGGAMLALLQVGEATPAMEVIVFMLGASMASMAHITKAGTRLIVNASPEPFSNVLLSLIEDAGTVSFSMLTLVYPKLSFVLTLIIMGLIGFILPLIFRTVRMLLGALSFSIKCMFQKETAWTSTHILPLPYDTFLEDRKPADEKVIWTGSAYSIKVPGIPRFIPVQVVITPKAIYFLYKRWFRMHSKQLPISQIRLHKCYPGTLLTKWLIRTTGENRLLYMYRPLAKILPQDWVLRDDALEKTI